MTPTTQTPAVPPASNERLLALDTTRGVALLGIMLVNVHFFTGPIASFYSTGPTASGGAVPTWLDEAAYLFSRTLCEGKFFPLYSMMFGAGMVLILSKTQQQGRSFTGVFARRLGLLAVIGLCHGFLLWYGDILFAYSILGLLLLVMGPRCTPRTLTMVGGILVGVGMMLVIACGGLTALGEMYKSTPKEMSDATAALPAGQRLLAGMADQSIVDPQSPAWIAVEREAYTQGPYLEALIVRSIAYGFSGLMTFVMMGPVIAGMFLLGAGLMKQGFWNGQWTKDHRTMLLLGMGIGLPACLASTIGARFVSPAAAQAVLMLGFAFGPLLTLGFAALLVAWVRSGLLSGLARLVAVPGRMGLTNYLLTTLLMTFINYHWGLALWGTFGSAEQVGLCLLVYLLLLGFSHLWMNWMLVGPVEWVWKSFAYLRAAPLARPSAGANIRP